MAARLENWSVPNVLFTTPPPLATVPLCATSPCYGFNPPTECCQRNGLVFDQTSGSSCQFAGNLETRGTCYMKPKIYSQQNPESGKLYKSNALVTEKLKNKKERDRGCVDLKILKTCNFLNRQKKKALCQYISKP